jgi:hypothetical protein
VLLFLLPWLAIFVFCDLSLTQFDVSARSPSDKYNAQGCAWSGDFFDPTDYERYEDMTAERLAMLEPPNARYPGRPGSAAASL